MLVIEILPPDAYICAARATPMPRPIYAAISRSALVQNLEVARQRAPQSKVWAVVKSRGYGHGLSRTAKLFAHADGLALLDIEEAAKIRERGWKKPILVLSGFFHAGDLVDLAGLQLTPVIHATEQIEILSRMNLETSMDVYLKMNSGMNRLGIPAKDYKKAYERLRAIPYIREISLMTHFGEAEGPRGVSEQLLVFEGAAKGLAGPRSLANSAATLRYPNTQSDWIRVGLMLYGASPFADQTAAEFGLRPAMSLKSEIIAIQQLKRGDSIGYGSSCVAQEPMRIGIVAAGYADGYPYSAQVGTPVVVGGVRTHTVSHVCMDVMMVDLNPVPHAGVGTSVTLWGSEGLSVEEVAKATQSISYRLMSGLSPRVAITDAK